MIIQSKKYAIIRIQLGRLGTVTNLCIKISSGDSDFDQRGLSTLVNWNHPPLHHPGKHKSSRQNQWYEVRYEE